MCKWDHNQLRPHSFKQHFFVVVSRKIKGLLFLRAKRNTWYIVVCKFLFVVVCLFVDCYCLFVIVYSWIWLLQSFLRYSSNQNLSMKRKTTKANNINPTSYMFRYKKPPKNYVTARGGRGSTILLHIVTLILRGRGYFMKLLRNGK